MKFRILDDRTNKTIYASESTLGITKYINDNFDEKDLESGNFFVELNRKDGEKFETADIVRFKEGQKEEFGFGLFEVTGYDADGLITLTKNECNTEFYSKEEYLILVCSADERVDI